MSLTRGDLARRLSVAICTHDRARLLRSALNSLAAAEPPRRLAWEVVVVLNDCHDGSDLVAAEFADVLPIRWVEEPRRGLSHARNRAVEAVTGDVIIWLDDDVRVGPRLLAGYEEAVCANPDAVLFGGAIVPCFEGEAPHWLTETLAEVENAFALKRPPPGGGRIVLGENTPYGANFAISAPVQRANLYDPRLGRQPGAWMIGGEETQVIAAVLASGGLGVWAPDAVVEHVLPAHRQTPAYLHRYFRGLGWLEGRLQPRGDLGARTAVREFADAAALELRYRWRRLNGPPGAWTALLRDSARAWGRWCGRYAAPPLRV
jgi:glycosyltransferase involved in cell wall biosynthesis